VWTVEDSQIEGNVLFQNFSGKKSLRDIGIPSNLVNYLANSRTYAKRVLGINCLKLLAGCFHAGFLLSLFFYPEDGGDMFLRNVC
jgi:hypothetical protein